MTRRVFLALPAAAAALEEKKPKKPGWPRWVTYEWLANTYGSFRWLKTDPVTNSALVEPIAPCVCGRYHHGWEPHYRPNAIWCDTLRVYAPDGSVLYEVVSDGNFCGPRYRDARLEEDGVLWAIR